MNEKQRLILGLNRNELKTIKSLSGMTQNIADLSRGTGLPKTTLNYIVRKLKQRGLLTTEPKGKRNLWKIRDNNDLREIFLSLGREFTNNKDVNISSIPISTNTTIEFYRGAKSLYQLWQKMSSLPRFTRLY